MLQELTQDPNQRSVFFLSLALVAGLVIYAIVAWLLRKYGRSPKYLLPEGILKKVWLPLVLLLCSLVIRIGPLRTLLGLEDYAWHFRKASTLLFIFSFTWLIIKVLRITKKLVVANYDIHDSDNLRARKVYTQFTILERIFIFILVILALGIALMSFESIREIGVSVFASAGVAGIIIGFSAQKMIGTILAGIQIALTQPIRLDDVVIVEGEWGRIEEITLTYVVVKIWDKRRLVVPTTYFIEKPFQNWTKTSSDILGTVYLYTDYTVPFDALRGELQRIVEGTDLWDGEVVNIQVTDSRAEYVEVRALVSARDASTAWSLRVHVREKLIAYLQENYPESIAHTRVLLNQNPNEPNENLNEGETE